MRQLFSGILLRTCFCLQAFCCLAGAEELPAILDRMNSNGPTLHAMSADIQMVTLTAVIDDKITENGVMKMKKAKGNVRAVVDFSAQAGAQREIGFFGKIIRIYYPAAHYYQDYDVGKSTDVLNQFLLLGFGSSGDDLAKSYTITSEGVEKVAGVMATKLALVPKDPKVAERLSKAELWIPEGHANPIQQQFYEASGNYRKVTYTNIRLNPPVKGDLDIQMLPGTQKRSS